MLGFDDEIVIGMCINYIKGFLEDVQNFDPRSMQIYMTGFLEKTAAKFCLELWNLLIEAQESPDGIVIIRNSIFIL